MNILEFESFVGRVVDANIRKLYLQYLDMKKKYPDAKLELRLVLRAHIPTASEFIGYDTEEVF